MYVVEVRIAGFRGIKQARIVLRQHCVLVGANNVGKTAVIEALTLLLGRDRLYRTLGEYDFFGANPSPTDRINIVAVITGFASDDCDRYPEIFNVRAATPFWWDPVKEQVTAREANSKLAIQLGLSARFDREDLTVECRRFFYRGDGDPFQEADLPAVPDDLRRTLGFFLLPSSRTWEKTMSFGSELFRRVLRFQEALPSAELLQLRSWLAHPDTRLEESPALSPIVDRVNAELSAFVGPAASALRFLPTYGDMAGVLDSLYPYLPARDLTFLPLGRHGSGVLSLQTLLLLLEFGRARKQAGQNFLLAAEEPELHLHPGHHRRLVHRIRGVSDQSIITTHSPEVASYHTPQEILFLRNTHGTLISRPLIPAAQDIPEKNALLRLFTLYRAELCEALMHELVLVPEGQTEFHWFKALVSASITAERLPAGENQPTPAFGVLPTQAASVVATIDHLGTLHDALLPLVDGDPAGTNYVKQLKSLKHPPKVVVQLGEHQTVEDLITWIIAADTALLEPISVALGFSRPVGLAELSNHLRGAELKTRWDLHEQVVALIAGSESSSGRARTFFADICGLLQVLPALRGPWKEDATLSNSMTTIYRFEAGTT